MEEQNGVDVVKQLAEQETKQHGELIVKTVTRTLGMLIRLGFHVLMVYAGSPKYFWPCLVLNGLAFANYLYAKVRMSVMTETIALQGPRLLPVYMDQNSDTEIQGIGVPSDSGKKN